MMSLLKFARKETRSDESDQGGLFIPAGIFIGMGIGFMVDNLVGGLFIGMGLGFLLFALVSLGLHKK